MISIGMTFLITSLAMSAIIILIMLLNRVFPKLITANLRHIIWLIILIGLIIPLRPVIGNGLLAVDAPKPINKELITSQSQAGNNKNTKSVNESGNAKKAEASEVADKNNTAILILQIWGIVAVGILGFNIYKYIKFSRMIKRWGVDVEDENTLAIFNSVKESKGISNKKIDLKICNFVNTSMITGIIKPVILLPDKHFDEDELEVIFNHELVHYKRHDLLVKLLIIIVSSLHWFNPIVYWMCSTMQIDAEAACDEVVLKDADIEDRQFYGEVIISMIGQKSSASTALSTCFYAGKSGIKRRLDFIMDARKPKKSIAVIAIAAVVIMTILSGSIIAFNSANTTDGNNAVGTYDEVSAKKAEEAALGKVGGGDVVKNEFDNDDGIPEYEIEIIYQNKTYEINVDANNYEITKYEIEDNNINSNSNQKNKTSSKITQSQAKEIALAKTNGGKITECVKEFDDGKEVYDITIVKGNKEYDMKIDVNNGSIFDYEIDNLEYDD